MDTSEAKRKGTIMEFQKDVLAGIPTAFGYRLDADGVYVWRRKIDNGIQTRMSEAQFVAAIREAAASDMQFLSFSDDDPFRVSFAATELTKLMAVWSE